jgi:hypothetical protein
MSAALGIVPSDDDKFLPVKAFGLKPRAPVGLISAIDALRDNALHTVLAGHSMELHAIPDLMIVVSQRDRRAI